MRKELVNIWNRVMRIKILHPLVIVGRKMIFSNTLNAMVDFMERHTNAAGLKETNDFFESNRERIACNKECLADEKSREVYENIIKYRSTLKRKYLYLARSPYYEQYFAPDIIKLKKHEFFIDCGAYVGDTILSLNHNYANLCKGGDLKALCLEPDPYNALQCRKTIKKIRKLHPWFRGYVMQRGAWKDEDVLYFKEGTEYSNKLGKTGTDDCTAVSTVSIDYAVRRYRIKTKDDAKVTFIKMDIEGSEPEALMGARETISTDRLVLVVSIYHTQEQMLSIIEYCRNNMEDYKFYIRHYSPAWGETDLYAVPCRADEIGNNV